MNRFRVRLASHACEAAIGRMLAGARRAERVWRAGLLATVALANGGAALAQDDDFDAPSARRAMPSRSSHELNLALARLASNPADLQALLEAGNAALALGDHDAAKGFLARADQLSPGNPRVKATLAAAMVRGQEPLEALRLFDEAERAGASVASLAGDRGLAYDLVGAPVEAQRYYRQALATAPSDEVSRRLALSLAIARDRPGFEATLLPQLRRNAPGAWRTRAFGLAILGSEQEAVGIARTTMPSELSQAVIPYLRYMPQLTAAQQAAAANFGHFPKAAQIGRDDPRIARYAAARPQAGAARGPDGGLIPAGDPLGRKSTARNAGSARAEARASRQPRGQTNRAGEARPVPASRSPQRPTVPVRSPAADTPTRAPVAVPPARVVSLPAAAGPPPLAPTAAPAPAVAPAPAAPSAIWAPSPLVLPATSAVSQRVATAPSGSLAAAAANADAGVPQPGSALAAMTVAPSPPSAPAAPPVSASPSLPSASSGLAAAFRDFRPPADEQASGAPAIDLATVAPAAAGAAGRTAAEAPPEPPAASQRQTITQPAARAGANRSMRSAEAARPVTPTHPSRIWVQVATGSDRQALLFDWRRLSRQATGAFAGRKAWLSPFGANQRLLVGPFESQAAAQTFINQLKAAELAAFVWTSPAGQVVNSLPIR